MTSLRKHGRRAPGSSLCLGTTAFTAALLLATVALPAGSQGTPALRKRPPGGEMNGSSIPVAATGHTDLPPEAEGRYAWGGNRSEIELYFEQGKLFGYMLQHLDPDPHASAVTFDFTSTHIDGHRLEWATRQVHGVAYSFIGRLERGAAPGTSVAGYYLLIGTITQHGGGADGLTSAVSLKREPGSL